MASWPSLTAAARHMMTAEVQVAASLSGSVFVRSMRMCVQPRTAYEQDTVLGKFTSATMLGFCSAQDENLAKRPIRSGNVVREIADNGAVLRQWEVSDDPENYADTFLVVPLRPLRTVR